MNDNTCRYDVRHEDDGLWTVYDVFTGQAAVYEDRTTTNLDMDDAINLSDLLNTIDFDRRSRR